MGEYLIISDDLSRAERFARDLSVDHPCRVHDLYVDDLPDQRPRVIIGDIAQLTSEAFTRLQRCLTHVRSDGAPFLFLVHGHVARAEVQARLLHATAILPATMVAQAGLARLRDLDEEVRPITTIAHKLGDDARIYLNAVFFSGQRMTPSVVDTGTGLILHAVSEIKIRDWIRTVQRFDDVTHQHMLLVAGLAAAFATSLGLNELDQHRLTEAALLHDVGKTKIPSAILNKPGPLDAGERAVMQTHAALGYDMLVGEGFRLETLAAIRSHHEMLDGSGYPDRLKGADISDFVRLISVCDVYAALIERRPYRVPMPEAKARNILHEMSGRLDPDLVRAFRPVIDEVHGHQATRAA